MDCGFNLKKEIVKADSKNCRVVAYKISFEGDIKLSKSKNYFCDKNSFKILGSTSSDEIFYQVFFVNFWIV